MTDNLQSHILLCVRRPHKRKERCFVFVFTGKISSKQQKKVLDVWIPKEERIATQRIIKHTIIQHAVSMYDSLYLVIIISISLCFLICFRPNSFN